MPTVSIIVPVYNAEKALGRCIESILNQEYQDFELLLMDDGSRDGSAAIIDAYAAADARIRAVHKPNSGVSDTRNKAIDMAQGEFIQFLDADDWITPDATRKFVRAAQKYEADMVIADFYRVVGKNVSPKGDIDTEGVITRIQYADYMLENPADYYYGVIWNKLYRKSILDAHGLRMDENISYCEDFIFNMEYVLHTEKIAVVKSPVYYYVKTEGSLVSQNMNPAAIVKMKANVIQYYDAFYRNVFDDVEYLARKPEIYSFLLGFAKDDAAISVLPGTRKLGEESVTVIDTDGMDLTVFAENYYEDKLLDYYLLPIAQQEGLEMEDAAVLLYVQQAGGPVTEKMIANYTRMGSVAATASIQKLRFKKLIRTIRPNKDNEEAARSERYRPAYLYCGSENLADQLRQVFRDFDALRFDGFSEREKREYRELAARSVERIRAFLSKV